MSGNNTYNTPNPQIRAALGRRLPLGCLVQRQAAEHQRHDTQQRVQ